MACVRLALQDADRARELAGAEGQALRAAALRSGAVIQEEEEALEILPDAGGVTVRRAKPGESMVTLDGQTRLLSPEDIAICDANGAGGIAGVMGGASSEVSDGTKRL